MRLLKHIVATAFSVISIYAFSQNPICPTGTFIPDPSARIMNGKIYIYGSLDKNVNQYCSDTYHVLSSDDACNWTLHRDAFRWNTTIYAPDLAKKSEKYYLYYEVPDGTEYVAEGDSPTGPFRDGKKIEGPRQIDPCVFIDDDGQAYYFWGQFSAKGAKMNPDMKTIDQSSMRDSILTEAEHGFHEGIFMAKRDGHYYLVYADISRNHRPTCIGYAMASSPFGPYEYKGVIVDNAGCDPGVWNNHGSIIRFGDQWYVLYHRSTNGCEYMRRACIEPIHFNSDGTIDEVEMTSQGAGKPLNAFSNIEAERACILSGHCRIRMMEGCSDNEQISEIRNQDTAVWKYLDFGKGARKITLRMKAPAGCTVKIYADSEYLGSAVAEQSESWNDISGAIRKTKGIHSLKLEFESSEDCFLDRLTFK